jgi:hypothetical protein
VTLVLGLAVINATGVYAQLVAAHVGERDAAAAAIETQDAELAGRIEVAAHTVADLDARVAQIDSAIAEARRIGQHMTALATYLGHVNIYSTYWYLEAAPDLLQDIAAVGETFMGGGAQS